MESVHNKIMQLIFFSFALSAILCTRLFVLQVVRHDYYLEKTLKQRKKSKNPLYSRKYNIIVEKSAFDIEIIPKKLLNKDKKLAYNESVTRLANLLGYSSGYVWQECLKKEKILRKKIDAKAKEEYEQNGGDWQKIIREKEEMYFNRPYPIFYNIDKNTIMRLAIEKHVPRNNDDILIWRDLYTGFVVRRRAAKQKKRGR
ncbi:hypothetical protein [Candidatus Uabimicrobium amorphum]|uniref:Uncharacterized protein n=1 Tax=Uabimicrobium amorphum TaxID=2596890 RepID=A0A5S9F2L0_UABAM|nr:hypothetical protein [Candidatus Uabimicrobium amorphum]BBM83223.1 hypothetical protein UABAM_01574 [Candidatus Uabimicrobium amorphum]